MDIGEENKCQGIGDSCFDRKKLKYFSQITATETVELPKNLPDIEQLISSIVHPEIISVKAVDTEKGLSMEGQYLSGKKLAVEIKLRQKILYVAEVKEQTVHSFEHEFFQSAYVVIPKYFEGSDCQVLLDQKFLRARVDIEDVIIKKVNKRTFFKCVFLLVFAQVVPTYELCYSLQNNCCWSNICIAREDGSDSIPLTIGTTYKNIKPTWSPTGQDIAFLSDKEGCYQLNVLNLKHLKFRQVTNSRDFLMVTSFCWTADGKKLFFTGVNNNCGKEIFCIELSTQNYSQITFGTKVIKSFRPKCSSKDSKVAFLRAVSGVTNLCFIDISTGGIQSLTKSGFVRDFDWCAGGSSLLYIKGKDWMAGELCFIDLKDMKEKIISSCSNIEGKRKIRCSPCGNYAAFIGVRLNTEDIYLLELSSKRLINLTKNREKILISDLVWKIDGTMIYFSANDLFFSNGYSISLDCEKTFLFTGTGATEMEFSYRPRII